jgi:hypothetical protein
MVTSAPLRRLNQIAVWVNRGVKWLIIFYQETPTGIHLKVHRQRLVSIQDDGNIATAAMLLHRFLKE